MSDLPIPPSLTINLKSLIGLAVEWWRLSAAVPDAPGAARHALRKMGDFLHQCELEIQSLDGRPFDPGMAASVLDTIHDPSLARGQIVIDQTISPIILWRGTVVKPAEVVTRRGS